jgi:type I restriction enzyme S subunit
MVPEGWYSTKLGKVFKSRRERGHDGLPTISVTLNNGLVLRESLDRKTDTTLSPEEHLLVRKGDIAYNMMRMWQGASGLAHFDALVSPAYIVLKPTKDIDSAFASYLFKSARMIHLLWAYSYGLTSDRLRLYFGDFSLIPAILPPIEEQRRIAEILNTWDRAIDKIDKLIENSEARKRALTHQLLTGAQRLPSFHRPWRQKTLRSLGPFKKGKGLSRDHVGSHGVPCVLYGDLYTKYDSVVRAFTSFIPAASAGESQLIRKGDLLFTASGETAEEIGKCVAYLGNEDAYAGGDILIQSPKSDDPEYLGYLLNHASVVQQRTRLAQGHSIVHISAANLGAMVLNLPDQKEQRAIAALLSKTDHSTRNLIRQRDHLASQKEALMQQLLTGKCRVRCTQPKEVARA